MTGRNGIALQTAWQSAIGAYHEITVTGFPNFFMLLGPNTFLGHNSVIMMIEAQADYVIDCLRQMQENGLRVMDVRPEAQLRFDRWLQSRLKGSVWQTGGCRSWYQDDAGRNVALAGFHRELPAEYPPDVAIRLQRRVGRPKRRARQLSPP